MANIRFPAYRAEEFSCRRNKAQLAASAAFRAIKKIQLLQRLAPNFETDVQRFVTRAEPKRAEQRQALPHAVSAQTQEHI
jgi:hypothetical protein